MPDFPRRLAHCFWACAVFCGLTVLLVQAVVVRAESPVQHDILLLLDNSGSMVRPYRLTAAGSQPVIPYDAEQRRIRFSRFLIRLLQTSPSEATAVGAALFAAEVKGVQAMSNTVVLAPLTALPAWTAADVEAIQQQPCPSADARGSDGRPVAQQAGRDFCYGTRYAAVFDWAAQQLQHPVTCGSPTRRCDILIFTDGALQEPNSDTAAVVARSLRTLASQGIKVSVILFSSPNTAPANVKEWQEWQRSGILEKVTTYSRDLPIRQLYEQGLDSLGLTALLNGYTPVELPQETIVLADQLPLNTTNLRLDLITDSPISDTYSVSPTLVADRLRWWSAPPFATLTGALQGSGLVYYRIVSETIPVAASVTLLPETQQVSKTVGIQVFVGAGFHVLDDSSVQVTGLVEPEGITAPLHYDGVVWRGELPILKSGAYTVTALIEPLTRTIVGQPDVQTRALKIVSRPQPKAILRVIPATLFAGRRFEIDASLLLEDMPTDLLSEGPATVMINPGSRVVTLTPVGMGTWQGSAAIEQPGEYQISGQIREVGVVAAAEPISLTVLAYPQIQITTPVTEAVAGQIITVTVAISPAAYPLTPTVWIQRSLGRTGLDVKRIAAGLFEAEVTMEAGRDLRINAEVPAGEIQGARFETVRGEMVLVRQSDADTKNSIPLILGVLAAVVVGVIIWLWNRDPKNSLIPKLIEGKEKWSLLDTLSVEKNWREVRALGEYADEGVLEYGEQQSVNGYKPE